MHRSDAVAGGCSPWQLRWRLPASMDPCDSTTIHHDSGTARAAELAFELLDDELDERFLVELAIGIAVLEPLHDRVGLALLHQLCHRALAADRDHPPDHVIGVRMIG